MALLCLNNVSVTRGGTLVLSVPTMSVGPGELVGLIGPNGAGKTTLLRAAMGLIAHQGHSSLAAMPHQARARHCAWLPQAREVAWPISVADLVCLGRIPWDGHDPNGAVARAMILMGISEFAGRAATDLSGGEQARVLIARALAQDTPLILADEPAAGLDPAAQIRLMQTFSHIAAEGRGVLAAIHDLGLAARYCTRLVMLSEGRIVADGAIETVLTDDLADRVFGISGHLNKAENKYIYQVTGTTR